MAVRPEVRVTMTKLRAPEGERETGRGRSPALLSMAGTFPYSAFIRAIIFLFAAFSFRFRRSLGFSKCW